MKTIGYTDELEEDKKIECMGNVVLKEGVFAETFAVNKADKAKRRVKCYLAIHRGSI